MNEKEWRRMNLEWERRRRDARWALIGPEYSALIGPEYSALIGPQGGGGEAAGAGQRGEATQDGAQAEVQGGELQNFNCAHF